MATKAVATKEQASLPAEYSGLEVYEGQGLDDLDSSDRSIPFLKVLEKNSPEIETVDGARPGMIIDTSTLEVYDSIRFVPVCREHAFVEWVPIDSGGGYVASYSPTSDIGKWAASQRGKIKLRNGNDLVETFYLFGLLLGDDDADPKPAVISFTSTRIKTYKTIVNRSDSIMLPRANGQGKFKAPWFCHVWRIGTEKKQDGNQSWYVYTASFDSKDGTASSARLPADHIAVQMGAAMVEQKRRGELKMSLAQAPQEQPDTVTLNGSYTGADDEPPF